MKIQQGNATGMRFMRGWLVPMGLLLSVVMGMSACEKKSALPPMKLKSAAPAEPLGDLTNAKNLHRDLLTVDSHIDIPISLGTGDADPSVASPMQVDIPGMQVGGLDAGFFVVYVEQGPLNDVGYRRAYAQAQKKFAAIERMLNQNSEHMALVRTPDELRQAVSDAKLAVAIGVENAYSLGANFEHLREFYDRGARYISLTHFGHNHFADSSKSLGERGGVAEPSNAGISAQGLSLIDEMNRLGMMVDVSHTATSSTLAAVAYSKTPVIASHSSVKALNQHARNLSDMEIKAIAERGGVVQLVAFDAYLRPLSEEEVDAALEIKKRLGLEASDWYKTATQSKVDELRRERIALGKRFPRATVATFVDHIDYVVELVGIDHVGIASDFGGGGGVEGWDYVAQTPAVTDELIKRGYSKADIEKIWADNVLRVWQTVEDYAKKAAQR